jgi:NADPH:quinone reductase-like Zn-dependent oxidoreductase
MHAIVLNELNQKLQLKEVETPSISDDEVLVKISFAALNHRDLWIQKGQYGGIVLPVILGADGCGIVEKTGKNVASDWLQKEVILNPSINWGSNPKVQAKDYIMLGTPSNGTFAQYLKVNKKQLHLKPSHLSAQQAAALPLAGLTGFRATMKRAAVKANENVLITGIGGGVALLCMQFAIAAGCNVFVTSGSDDKIAKAIKMGAKSGINYKNVNWDKELKSLSGGFDAMIDSSGGSTFSKLVDMAKPAGRIAMYGATLGAFDSGVPAKIFWKQLDILGSTMGNDQEFEEMVAFVNEHKIVPVLDELFNLEDAQMALDKMAEGNQFGKIVLQVT